MPEGLEDPWLLVKWVKDLLQTIFLISGSIWSIVVMYRSKRPSSYLKHGQLAKFLGAPLCLQHPIKKQCFVQKELDQFNKQNMHKTFSKIKANSGRNLGGNATEIQWQCNKPNNGSSQYSVMIKGN